MNPHFFYVYYNKKTPTKEITWEEWRKIAREDYKRKTNTRFLIRIDSSHVYFRKGNDSIWIRKEKLQRILNSIGFLT